jgi:hypothetical protein
MIKWVLKSKTLLQFLIINNNILSYLFTNKLVVGIIPIARVAANLPGEDLIYLKLLISVTQNALL